MIIILVSPGRGLHQWRMGGRLQNPDSCQSLKMDETTPRGAAFEVVRRKPSGDTLSRRDASHLLTLRRLRVAPLPCLPTNPLQI